MATNNFNYKVGLTIDKSGLTDLNKSIDDVIEKAKVMRETVGDYAIPFEEAAEAARDLRNAMNSAYDNKLGKYDLSKVTNQLKSMYGSTKDFKQMIGQAGSEGVQAFNSLQRAILNTNIPLAKTESLLDKMATTMGNTVKWGISSSIFNSMTGSLQKAYGYVEKLDKSLNNIRIVSGQTADQMERFALQANAAAATLGSTTLDYTNASLIYYQQGLAESEVIERTNTTIKMANVLGESAQNVSSYMTAIWNNFDDGSKSLEYYGDVITNLGAKTAASADEIAEGLEKFAAIGETVGLSYEYATTALATVVAQTRQSADTVGTAFKTLFARIEGLKLGETLEDGTTLNKYSQALENVGVNIKNQNGELRDMDDILKDMGAKWKTLNRDQQVALAQTVAGTRQYSQLVALMDNWDTFEINLDFANNSEGTLEEQQEIYLDSIEGKLNTMTSSIQKIWTDLFDEEIFKSFVDGLTIALKGLDAFLVSLQGGLNQIIYLSSFIANIFQNQIGKFLAENQLKKAKQFLINEQEIEYLNALKDQLDTVYKTEDAALKVEYEYLQKIFELKSNMTEDEHKTSLEVAKRIAQREVELQDIQAVQALLQSGADYSQIEKSQGAAASKKASQRESTQALSEAMNISGTFQSAESDKEFKAYYQTESEAMSEIGRVLNIEINARKEKIELLQKDIDSLKELKVLNEDDEALLRNKSVEQKKIRDEEYEYIRIKKKIQKGETISVDQASKLKETIEDQVKELQKEENAHQRVAETAKKMKKDGEGYTKSVKEAQKADKDNLDDVIERNSYISKSQQKVAMITTSLSSLTGIFGGLKTLFNPDLSGWEKMQSLVSLIAVQGTLIASNFNNLKDYVADTNAEMAIELFNTGAIAKAEMQISGAKALELINEGSLNAFQENILAQKAKELLLEKGVIKEEEELTNQKLLQLAAQEGLTLSTSKLTAEELRQLAANKGLTLELTKQSLMRLKDNILNGIGAAIDAIRQILQGNIAAAIVAGVVAMAAMVAVGWKIVSSLKDAFDQEKKLNEEIDRTQENLNKAKEAYDELKGTVSDYRDGVNALDSLTEGTVEFYEAVMKANESAQELIEKLGLIAGQDYAIDKNGLISINDDALENGLFKEQQKVFQAQGANINARYNLAKYKRDKAVDDFQDAVNIKGGGYKGMSRREAESYLNRTVAEKKNADGTYSSTINGSFAEEYKSILDNSLNKVINDPLAFTGAVLTGGGSISADMIATALTESGVPTDITEEIGIFRAEYEKNSAEMKALELQRADSYIRAYGDKAEVDRYNKTTSTQRENMQNYINAGVKANQTEEKSDWASFWDASDDGFWTTMGKGLLNGVISVATLGLGNFATVGSALSGPSDLEVKEEYAKNVLGYEKTGNQWYDQNGNKIKESEIKDIDTDTAKAAYASGEYSTSGSIKNFNKLAAKSEKASEKAGLNEESQDYVKEAMMALYSGNTNYDFSVLTKEELAEVRKQLQPEIGKDNFMASNKDGLAKNKDLFDAQSKTASHLNAADWNKTDDERAAARRAEDLKRYNEELDTQAKALGTSSSALKLYSIAMQNANKNIDAYTKTIAKSAAENYKFNKAYNEGVEVFDDNKDAWNAYIKALKDGEQVSYDVADGAGAIVEQLETMGIKLTDDDLKNPEALKNINTLFKGTEAEAKKAYETLRDNSWVNDLTTNLGMAEDAARSFISILKDTEIGEEVDLSPLTNKLGNTTKTLEDWKAWAEQYGVDIEIPETAVSKGETPGESTTTTHTIKPYTDSDGGKHAGYTYEETVTTPGKTLYALGDLKVKRTSLGGGGNFKKSIKNSNSGSKKEDKKKSDAEIDRYQKVNEELAKISNTLNKLQKQEERLTGKALVQNLAKQLVNINKELTKTDEKLAIANQIQGELQQKLGKYGVSFDGEGIMQNYAQIWNQKKAAWDAAIDRYNKSKTEANEKAVDDAEEDFNKFLDLVSKYDDNASTRYSLAEQKEEEITKAIEAKLKMFNLKVKVTLELEEAKKNWAEFKRDVLDGLTDRDILGNATWDFERFQQILEGNSLGILTEHLKSLNQEWDKMMKGQISDIFGYNGQNDWNKWLEDAKEDIGNLEDVLTELHELEISLHERLIASLDQTSDYMADKQALYDAAIADIQHSMNLIQYVYGEDAYAQLSEYYDAMKDMQQRDYQNAVNNTLYWRSMMDQYTEGTEEWENARDKWLESLSEEQSKLEAYLETMVNDYVNAINEIFTALNDKMTNGKGLDYINEEWQLINAEADAYLDTINSQFGIQQLQNKYLDAIDDTDNVKYQQKLTDLMNEQVAALKEQDKLSQYDLDRADLKYQIALKRIALEEAQQNKSNLRLRRDSQGNYSYQYTADNDEVSKAQEELSNLYNQLYNLDTGHYKENLNEIYSIWAEYQQKMVEAAQINDPEQRWEREELLTKYYNERIDDLIGDNEEVKRNLYESTFLELEDLYGHESEEVSNMLDHTEETMSKLIVGWNSSFQQMADTIRGEGGFEKVYEESLDRIQIITKAYQDELDIVKTKLQEQGGAQSEVNDKLNTLMSTTDRFTNSSKEATHTIEGYIGQLEGLKNKYKQIKDAIDELIKSQEKYEKKMKQDQSESTNTANDVNTQVQQQQNNQPKQDQPVVQQPASPQGNGKVDLGDQVTLNGKLATSSDKSPTLNPISKYRGAKLYVQKVISGKKSPYHLGTSPNYSSSTAVGWVDINQISGYDTGGYTGDWSSNGGKLAFLHQKELVLNKQDTENLLNAVSILRTVMGTMNASLSSQMSGLVAGKGYGVSGQLLEQDVRIEAHFPNVTSSNEIEEALNNLVNAASQRIHSK